MKTHETFKEKYVKKCTTCSNGKHILNTYENAWNI